MKRSKWVNLNTANHERDSLASSNDLNLYHDTQKIGNLQFSHEAFSLTIFKQTEILFRAFSVSVFKLVNIQP